MTGVWRRASLGIVVLLSFAVMGELRAQTVEVGGRAYVDYFYQLSSPDADLEGLHGFTYRRLYLTTDVRLSDDFRGRARLEANDGTMGPKGPVPYVKDLWIEWKYAGDHSATLGVTPPPAFQVSEGVWGYRSLEKTVLDLQGITSSRDFGLRLDGPVAGDGSVRYAVMVANNEGVAPETDAYKRGYAQLSFHPSETLSFSVGADHAAYGDDRDRATRASAFGGYQGDGASLGAEVYWFELDFTDQSELRDVGLSLFGSMRLSPEWELVARTDVARETPGGPDIDDTFLIAGAAYSPIDNLRIIPHLWLFDSEAESDSNALARVTVELNF